MAKKKERFNLVFWEMQELGTNLLIEDVIDQLVDYYIEEMPTTLGACPTCGTHGYETVEKLTVNFIDSDGNYTIFFEEEPKNQRPLKSVEIKTICKRVNDHFNNEK